MGSGGAEGLADDPGGDAVQGPYADVAAWLDRLLQRHPRYAADDVLELREEFLEGGDEGSAGTNSSASGRVTDQGEAADRLSELRTSFFEREPGEIEAALERLDLSKRPLLRALAQRLLIDDALRSVYLAMEEDRGLTPELRGLLVGNVVLPWRERRQELANYATALMVGDGASALKRGKARRAARRIARRYPEIEGLHGGWLREVRSLPRWNPLRSLFRLLRTWVLNYLGLIWLMILFVALFAAGAQGHRFFLSLFGGGES